MLRSLKWWVSNPDREIVTRQLATMIESGLPMMQSIGILETVSARPVAKRLRTILWSIRVGEDPEQALKRL